MLAQQSWDVSRKRTREDDIQYPGISREGLLGFTEHRNKRLQALPLRNFQPRPDFIRGVPHQSSSNQSQLPAWSALGSDSDLEDMRDVSALGTPLEPGLEAAQAPSLCAPELVDQYTTMSMDMDTGMAEVGDDMAAEQQKTPDRHHLGPGPSQPDAVLAGPLNGRIPTPIHCSFASQVRGNNWPGNASHESIAHRPREASGLRTVSDDQVIPRSSMKSLLPDWNMTEERRLPSPIRESADDGQSSPIARMQHDGLVGAPIREMDGMDMDDEVASSPRRGHIRSRHTVNSWTLQPGMKRSFSIGYRADCEKCRQKIPGHFNHIIVS